MKRIDSELLRSYIRIEKNKIESYLIVFNSFIMIFIRDVLLTQEHQPH